MSFWYSLNLDIKGTAWKCLRHLFLVQKKVKFSWTSYLFFLFIFIIVIYLLLFILFLTFVKMRFVAMMVSGNCDETCSIK
jgi:hypothetical protein